VRDNYLSSVVPGTGVHGSFYSYRDVYLDLDPTYRDRFGRPLMRITMISTTTRSKQNAFLTDRFAEIIKAMGANQVAKVYRKAPYDAHAVPNDAWCAAPSWAPIGRRARQSLSAKLGRAQFVRDGASAYPQNAGYNPTGTLCAPPIGRPRRSAINI